MQLARIRLSRSLLLLFALLGAAAPAAFAQNTDCALRERQCMSTCTLVGRMNREMGQSCVQGCANKRAQCDQGPAAAPAAQTDTPGAGREGPTARGGRRGGDAAAAAAPPQIDVDAMTEPLSDDVIRQLAAAAVAADGGMDDTMARIHELRTIPACDPNNRNFRNPSDKAYECASQREALLKGNRTRSTDNRVLTLRPLVRSVQIEAQRVPAEPLAAIGAIELLRGKYRPIFNLVPLLTANSPMSDAARSVLTAAAAQQKGLIDAHLRAARTPEVRQAFFEGRLPEGTRLELPTDEMNEWVADRDTWQVAQPLRQQGRKLFMDRTTELQHSTREANQPTQFASWGEPSETEMGLALLRTLSLVLGEQTRPYESQRASVPGLPTLVVVRIVDVQKIGCRKIGDGFRCRVRVWMTGFLRGLGTAGLGSSPLAAMSGINAWKTQNGNEIEHLFRANPFGWIAPEQIERLANSDKGLADNLRKSEESSRSARCASARMSGDLTQQALNCK